jgi:peptidoglycan L-alanyl-D-glutamate endopeptidase CwlK
MGINRSIGALAPLLAEAVRRFLERCREENFPVVIIETERSQAVQNAYYAQGRERLEVVNSMRKIAGLPPLKDRENTIITNARVSNHTGGNAVDLCPEIAGKPGYPWWNAPEAVWQRMGALAEGCGLDWCAGGYGQTWGKGWDNPHFELMREKEAA